MVADNGAMPRPCAGLGAQPVVDMDSGQRGGNDLGSLQFAKRVEQDSGIEPTTEGDAETCCIAQSGQNGLQRGGTKGHGGQRARGWV